MKVNWKVLGGKRGMVAILNSEENGFPMYLWHIRSLLIKYTKESVSLKQGGKSAVRDTQLEFIMAIVVIIKYSAVADREAVSLYFHSCSCQKRLFSSDMIHTRSPASCKVETCIWNTLQCVSHCSFLYNKNRWRL